MRADTTRRSPLSPRVLVTARHIFRSRAMVSFRAEISDPDGRFTIGRKSSVSAFVSISTNNGAVKIGERTDVGSGCCIDGHAGDVVVGDDCLLSPNSVIGAPDPALDRAPDPPGPTQIGNNVWIGAGAIILAGATLADNVIVSPNSVVAGSVSANAIVQGNPAKVIFTRR